MKQVKSSDDAPEKLPLVVEAKNQKNMIKVDKAFANSPTADRSIYDVFRRSKHKLYEIDPKTIKKLMSPAASPTKSSPIGLEKKVFNADANSLFQSFKRHQGQEKNSSILPAVKR